MIPAYWYSPLPSYLWQVVLHSWILGMIFYAWAHHVQLPSGRAKRRLLAILLVLPFTPKAVVSAPDAAPQGGAAPALAQGEG